MNMNSKFGLLLLTVATFFSITEGQISLAELRPSLEANQHPRVEATAYSRQTLIQSKDGLLQTGRFNVHNGESDLSLVLSTGKSWTAIGSPYCSGCHAKISQANDYDLNNSTYYVIEEAEGRVGQISLEMEYSEVNLRALFDFLAVDEFFSELPAPLSGYIGLARSSKKYLTGPSFIDALVEANQIRANIVTFAFPDQSMFPSVTWGSYSRKDVLDNLFWIPQKEDEVYWTSEAGISSIIFDGGVSYTKGYSYGEKYSKKAYFDTGNTFIKPPAGVGADLLRHLLFERESAYLEHKDLILVKCEEYFPDFQLLIDGVWFQVRSDDYKKRIGSTIGSFDCFLTIKPSDEDQDYWVLGTTFMKGYMVVFDNEMPFQAEMGIGRYKDSQKKPIYAGGDLSVSVLDVQGEMGADHFSFVLSNQVLYSEIITQKYDLPKVFSTIGGEYPLQTAYIESDTPMMMEGKMMETEDLPNSFDIDLAWLADLIKALYLFIVKLIEIPLAILFIVII